MVLLRRTIGRQICPNCKQTYNMLTGVNPPLVENMCNDCNVELTKRNDDNEETLKVGYNAYLENATPVIEYFREKGNLSETMSIINEDLGIFTKIKLGVIDSIIFNIDINIH